MNILKTHVLVNGRIEVREVARLDQENNKFDIVPKLNEYETISEYKDGMAVIVKSIRGNVGKRLYKQDE